jgi:hypothetical protein
MYTYTHIKHPRTSGSISSHKNAWLNHGSLVRGADTTWVWSASPIRWSTVVHWPCPTAPRLEGCASPWPQQRVTWFSSDVELEFFHLYVYMYDKYIYDIHICMYDIKYYIYIWNIECIRHVILIILYLIYIYMIYNILYIYDVYIYIYIYMIYISW